MSPTARMRSVSRGVAGIGVWRARPAMIASTVSMSAADQGGDQLRGVDQSRTGPGRIRVPIDVNGPAIQECPPVRIADLSALPFGPGHVEAAQTDEQEVGRKCPQLPPRAGPRM